MCLCFFLSLKDMLFSFEEHEYSYWLKKPVYTFRYTVIDNLRIFSQCFSECRICISSMVLANTQFSLGIAIEYENE